MKSMEETIQLSFTLREETILWILYRLLRLTGRVAPFTSLVMIFSPLPTILQIQADESVGIYPLLPYTIMTASTFLWAIYGLKKHEPSVWFANIVGVVAGAYFVTQYIKYSPRSSPTIPGSITHHCIALLLVLCLGTILVLARNPLATEIVGISAVVLTVGTFASPLAAIKVVLETKSATAIPLPFTLAAIACCSCWTVFGVFIVNDHMIYVTNAVGLVFALAQLALKFRYPDRPVPKISSDSLMKTASGSECL